MATNKEIPVATDNTNPHPPLVAQATRIVDIGLAAAVGKAIGQGEEWSLEAYLADVVSKARFCPKCAAEAAASSSGEVYILCEPRAGFSAASSHGSIVFGGNDATFVPFDDRHAVPLTPYWVILNPGRGNRNKPPVDCRAEFAQKHGILSARAMDGVFARIHHPNVVTELHNNPDGHAMDLAGSLCAAHRGRCAFLHVWFGQARVVCHDDGSRNPQHGPAFLRECRHLNP